MTPVNDPGFASTAFIILMSALVFIMTPAVGYFYSGLSRGKSALTNVMISMLVYAVVTIQVIQIFIIYFSGFFLVLA